MKFTPKETKRILKKCMKDIAQKSDNYVEKPGKHFTRKRKQPFEKVMKTVLGMTGKTLFVELSEQFGLNKSLPSVPAFIQQRNKINPKAFEDLFHDFLSKTDEIKLHRGYRLLAVDGSALHVPTNPKETESFHQKANGVKPYNALHLNALYDLERKLYVDALVQKGENSAFVTMVDRMKGQAPTIFIADRGFESYNNFAHVQEKGQKFLIRIKDITAKNGMCRGIALPDSDEFDVSITLNLTRSQTKTANAQGLKLIASTSPFDFLSRKVDKKEKIETYPLYFRILRFKLTDTTYETLATNLDESQFDSVALKELYNRRWGIETSFRSLKFTIGLLYFHAKKTKYILQEIFAKLIMYNFVQLIASHTILKQKQKQLIYQINFSVAAHICRKFFRKNISSSFVEAYITKNALPMRPTTAGTRRPRNSNPRSDTGFLYRLA